VSIAPTLTSNDERDRSVAPSGMDAEPSGVDVEAFHPASAELDPASNVLQLAESPT
jgi:hypothetical protein